MAITTRFDAELMASDMAKKGWMQSDMATAAGVASSTVGRFLSGKFQTTRTAVKLAKALGYSVRRYLVSAMADSARVEAAAERRSGKERRGGKPGRRIGNGVIDTRVYGRREADRKEAKHA